MFRRKVLYGQSGHQYQVESLTDLSDQTHWVPLRTISLTNSFQFLETPDRFAESGFYRIRER